jgi:SAM-dependent methyltransferase
VKSHVTETILPASGAAVSRCRTGMEGQGCRVTHFDISQPMIEKAKELAEREGVLDRITFVRGALENLEAFGDKTFDMVISFDAPVSYGSSGTVRNAAERHIFKTQRNFVSMPTATDWTYG